ncbi:MAG: hypothetical protein IPP58_00625 [Holophagaceae bacterium]|uniref:Uncharacterized protein n=1 Tax=Candidatus Geothrix skivensis TaxID=2954439 RepID=A0A9D7SE39_9BACT|nr:hypothetical protein [Candidatus Geothrix skivensis]
MATAGNDPDFLFKRQIQAHPAPKLEDVSGREYKFLIDATKAKGTPAEAFKVIWGQVKASAAKQGFTVTEKDKAPLKIEMTTKEYLDTVDQALWKQGYLIRITTKYKAGIADANGKVTVKAIFDDPAKTLATPLEVVGVKGEEECQDNAGPGKGGRLVGYIEKGASFSVAIDDLGKMTLGDFAKYARAAQTRSAWRHQAGFEQSLFLPRPAWLRGAPRHGALRRVHGRLVPQRRWSDLPLRLLLRI